MTMSLTNTCLFNQCTQPAIPNIGKCNFHKHRNKCSIQGCNNQVVLHNLCVRHGGKRLCQAEGCQQHARGGKWCLRHGGIAHKRYCSEPGCGKQAHANKKCIAHGGGRRCQVSGSKLLSRVGGYCQHHTVDPEAEKTETIDQLILDLVIDSTSCSFDWECLGIDDLDLTPQEDESMLMSQLVL
ncbi:hypothetical protein AC1031_012924 [Aphanomyces cochlioides]|nr:hypothetical protein AC1031_012924 [Aphanomyces cochlioides]